MPTLAFAYVIMDADVVSTHPSNITGMDPRKHVPASVGGRYPAECERIVEAFTETEGDEQYQYGHLADDGGDVRYYPFGYLDSEGCSRPFVVHVEGEPDQRINAWDEDDAIDKVAGRLTNEHVITGAELDEETPTGLGMHRKWVGELDPGAWRAFASAYDIELDEQGFPVPDGGNGLRGEPASILDYFGCVASIRYDNSEGWDYPGFGYGSVESVISADIDVAIAVVVEDHEHERGQLQPYEQTGEQS